MNLSFTEFELYGVRIEGSRTRGTFDKEDFRQSRVNYGRDIKFYEFGLLESQ